MKSSIRTILTSKHANDIRAKYFEKKPEVDPKAFFKNPKKYKNYDIFDEIGVHVDKE